MAEQVTAWKASGGSLHETHDEALVRETQPVIAELISAAGLRHHHPHLAYAAADAVVAEAVKIVDALVPLVAHRRSS